MPILTKSNGHLFDLNADDFDEHDAACQRDGCGIVWVNRSVPCRAQLPPFMGLDEWWRKVATEDAIHASAKADEYGSADLLIMGKAMEELFPGKDDMDPESLRRVGIEMAISFYNLGKAARTFGAYARGTFPSDDTWHDSTVYPMMARRVRETGMWP